MTLVMMTKRGALVRASRGVYRLVDFPVQPLALYMEATLWPYERPGVLSHATALSLYKLSDANPAKVHVTVPADFRVQRKIPDYLVVHRGDLSRQDLTRLEGMPITTPARTIRDCIGANLGPALITPALTEARRAGVLGATVASGLERELRAALSGEADAANAPQTTSGGRIGGTSRKSVAKTR
jgi:predicted transcriptional regulator of viral defense system